MGTVQEDFLTFGFVEMVLRIHAVDSRLYFVRERPYQEKALVEEAIAAGEGRINALTDRQHHFVAHIRLTNGDILDEARSWKNVDLE